MKFQLTLCLLLLSLGTMTAQDTLISSKGDTLLVEILSQDQKEIRFYRHGQKNAGFRANLKEVRVILYQDKAQHQDYYSDLTEGLKAELSDTSRLWLITTQDGNEFVGRVLENNEQALSIETELLGLVNIPKTRIKKISPVSANAKIIDGELWRSYPQTTRYLWAPNGYGLNAGEGYYQNIWILFNQVSVGLTDRFSVGAGVVSTFLFGAPSPVWITPKFSFPVVEDRFNIGGGALIGTVVGDGGGDGGSSNGFGIIYGVGTLGSKDQNITLGLGYGYASGSLADTPTITLSGMTRVGKKGYILTENYIIGTASDQVILLSLAGRIVWPQIALDFGGVIPATEGDIGLGVIPWLGISVPFGQ